MRQQQRQSVFLSEYGKLLLNKEKFLYDVQNLKEV